MIRTLKDISSKVPVKNPFAIVEEMGIPIFPTLLPGHMYYLKIEPDFQVTPDAIPMNLHEFKNNKDNKHYVTSKPYYDITPIGIALKLENEQYQSILNLKLISPLYRRMILESYYQMLENRNGLIGKWFNEDLTEAIKPIQERIRESQYINPFMAIDKSFMQRVVGSDISFAVKNYSINSIKNVKLLDWNALTSVYNMNITDSGITTNNQIGGLQEIQDMFESKFYPI